MADELLNLKMKAIYCDEDGNRQFMDYLLEEKETPHTSTTGISEESLTKIIESFADKKKSRSFNVGKMAENFVIEKFNSKITNVSQWMTIFETEYARVGIEEDVKKIEIFRLFLEDSSKDWYSSMLIKHTINSEWDIWKQDFCETYADKGWSPIRYAMLFKYRQGSLLDYALKKEKLLLEINKSIDKQTLIDLIATGLPNFIADRIDRNSLKESQDLFNSIRSLEHMVNKKTFDKQIAASESKIKEKGVRPIVTPCKICEKENKATRYHPESQCWFKIKNNDRLRKDQIRSVNNSELETELNEINPKN
ncbi:uncharacterized protein LOC121733888 isoform X2 [Aricia agestis]|uniref:uncharacterized protein LOC121733888 isoform X2 n=1 Tax=Aricia agestis TaxID=91739 RepID=UPI001C2054D4|nr:uncharacterized protein LOC121733888 isoform X2 [Aricia agestis]